MSDSREFDPFALSRRLQECAERHEVFLGSLRSGPGLFDPFLGKEFPGKSAYDEVADLDESDPLRAALLRWIHRLTDARIHVPWESLDADLEHRDERPIFRPSKRLASLSELRISALGAQGDRSLDWWLSFSELEKKLSDHRVQYWTRHSEVSARLGAHHENHVEVTLVSAPDDGAPSSEQALGQQVTADPARLLPQSLLGLARRALSETQDAAENLWGKGWLSLMNTATARSAPEGWPARLAPDTLGGLLRERTLFHGLDLTLGRLPARLCPMSFPRAAALLGRALSRALSPTDLPFVLARDPDDLIGHELGQLFFLWTTSSAFSQAKLDLSRSSEREVRRHWDAAVLAHVRLSAARYLTFRAANHGPRHLAEEFPKITQQLLGAELPLSAALVRFRIRENESARFVALLSAAARYQELTENYDEDWYRNPRAQEQLREEWGRPRPRTREYSHCQSGLESLLRRV